MRWTIFISFVISAIYCPELTAQNNINSSIRKTETDVEKANGVYEQCLFEKTNFLFKYDQNDKAAFPLLRIKDEDVYPIGKAACVKKREEILQVANDWRLTSKIIDKTDKRFALLFSALANKQRTFFISLAQEIHTPGPRKAVSLRRWAFNTFDYPLAAKQNNESGKVIANFLIDKDGKVTQCSAVGAPELLNSETCTVIKQRSSYAPALDASQNPIEETRTLMVRWSLPSEN